MKSRHVVLLSIGFCCFHLFQGKAQSIHFKNPNPDFVKNFNDSANRIQVLNPDSGSLLEHQYAYLLRFYPRLLFKRIEIKFVKSRHPVKIQARFNSWFKAPELRQYRVLYSKNTGSTMDSVLLDNLNFNAQLGFAANQISTIEDLSTGGFFNFLYWYFRTWTKKGRKKIYRNSEYRSIEMGLGYQVIAFNSQFFEALEIDNWQSSKGYSTYTKHHRNLPMKTALIQNLMADLPVYMMNNYK